MRRRRPLAASILGACLVAMAMLAVTVHDARPAAAPSRVVPLTVDPSCGAPSSTGGYQVHLTGTGLLYGANEISVSDPTHLGRQPVGSVDIPSDGTLDTTVTLPAEPAATLVSIYVSAGNTYGFAYFSVPCPTISVQPTCGPADDGGGASYSIAVTGTGFGPPPKAPRDDSTPPSYPLGGAYVPVHIELDGTEVPGSPAEVAPDGSISVVVTPGRVPAGPHVFHAYQSTGDVPGSTFVSTFRDARASFTVPCATTPPVTTAPVTTAPSTTAPTTTTAPATTRRAPTTAPVTTRAHATTRTSTRSTTTAPAVPTGPATLAIAPTCLPTGASGTTRVQLRGGDFAPGGLQVLVDGRVATRASAGGHGTFTAEVEIVAGSADHAIEARQGARRAALSLRVPCTSHPSLRLDPALGPPGFVTRASGSGFPPNTLVRLSWSVGLGTSVVRTNASGDFASQVLVFPRDEPGPRALEAAAVTGGSFRQVAARFLCLPGTAQPGSFVVRR